MLTYLEPKSILLDKSDSVVNKSKQIQVRKVNEKQVWLKM